MATLDEVRKEIDKDELDYPELALSLGAAALPQLQALVAEDEPRIASKAGGHRPRISPELSVMQAPPG